MRNHGHPPQGQRCRNGCYGHHAMKSSSPILPIATSVRLARWLKRPASAYTLVIGATCGCDISKLGKAVCTEINQLPPFENRPYLAFGPDAIREVAGVPRLRKAILRAASHKGIDADFLCDYECVLLAMASIGGLVLCGEWALDSCAGMNRVCRMALSHCGACRSDSCLTLDPDEFSGDGLARSIARRFHDWIQIQGLGRKSETLHTGDRMVFS